MIIFGKKRSVIFRVFVFLISENRGFLKLVAKISNYEPKTSVPLISVDYALLLLYELTLQFLLENNF